MNTHIRPTAIELLPSMVQRAVVCSEYGWRDYHYLLHSCYAQPDAKYWLDAGFELWRNTAMLTILTLFLLFTMISAVLIAKGACWLTVKAYEYIHNAFTVPTKPLNIKAVKSLR
jgi:hypothetical protein